MTPSVDILIQQAQLAEREGRRDDARSLFERALHSLRRGDDAHLASSLVRSIGRTYLTDGEIDCALDCLQAATAIAELSNDAIGISQALSIRAQIQQQ